MEAWELLLDRAVRGIRELENRGVLIPDLSLGGGTALMIQHHHRRSRDIDLFVSDPQYLSLLSPRLGGEDVWDTDAYDEGAHYLKIRYQEGEIDFIVSRHVSDVPLGDYHQGGLRLPIEHPVEIALKKLYHRSAGLKPRDIFDIAVVIDRHKSALYDQLRHLTALRDTLAGRLDALPGDYYEQALEQLDIHREWERLKPIAREWVTDLVAAIPRRG